MSSLLSRILVVGIASALPLAAMAESTFQTGNGSLSTDARLDFQVTIPAMLYLQVGAGPASALTTDSNISTIHFDVPAANVGNGLTIAATNEGNLGSGTVNARVVGNNGEIRLSAQTDGAMLATQGDDSISWSEIDTDPIAVTGVDLLSPPKLKDGSSDTVILTPVGRLVSKEATWVYSYLNSKVVSAGTYGDISGAGLRNGRVTYTAAMD